MSKVKQLVNKPKTFSNSSGTQMAKGDVTEEFTRHQTLGNWGDGKETTFGKGKSTPGSEAGW